MSTTQSDLTNATFACDECGHSYDLRPKLLGKKVRCKCGHVMKVPAQMPSRRAASPVAEAAPPPPPVEDEVGDYGLADDDDIVAEPSQPKQRACGNCGSAVEPEAVICVACGTDFRTGKPVAPASDKPAAASAVDSRFGIPVHQSGPIAAGPTDADKRRTSLILIGCVLAIALFLGLFTILQGLGGADATPSNLHPEDELALEKLDNGDAYEAAEWLESSEHHMLAGHNENQAEARVDRLYEMGAEKVYAFGARMSLSLVIELPQDPEARERLFRYRENYYKMPRAELWPDEGQEHMVLMMNL